jgi:hypothetical protein
MYKAEVLDITEIWVVRLDVLRRRSLGTVQREINIKQ